MATNIQDLEWCDTTEILEDILTNPKVNLPQIIKLASQFSSVDSSVTLKNEQVLVILAKRTVSKLNGIDSKKKCISLSSSCPYHVKFQPLPENEGKFYSLKDLVATDPLPRFVKVLKEGVSHSVKEGDLLKVVLVEKSGGNPSFVHFRSLSGAHIKIDINEDVNFQVAVDDSPSVLLSELLEKSREFPLAAQFCNEENIPKSYLELGTFTINNVSTEDIIIASANINTTEYSIVFPLNLAIAFQVNTFMKLANNKEYRELCSNSSNIDVEDVCKYLEMIDPKHTGERYIIKLSKKLHKSVATSFVLDSTNGEENFNTFDVESAETDGGNEIQDTNDQPSKTKQKDKKHAKVIKQKSKDIVKKEKKVKKEKEKDDKKKKKSSLDTTAVGKMDEDMYVIPQSTLPTTTNGTDHELTIDTDVDSHKEYWNLHLMKKVKKLYRNMSTAGDTKKPGKYGKPTISNGSSMDMECSAKTSSLESDSGISFEDNLYEDPCDISENLYCELPYQSLDLIDQVQRSLITSSVSTPSDSGFDEADQAKINAWRETMIPPPLPGNHPCQNKLPIVDDDENIYLDAVDVKKNTENFFDMIQHSTQEISKWDIDDVMRCLGDLNLQKHSKSFEDSLVDGKLLLDLDEGILRDLGLSLFEARKLRKFVYGWRPGKMRPEIYPELKGYSSNDPLDWNIDDTVSHMLFIDIRDMAEFCKQNQMDGELLKDICVDETIMGSIIPSRDKKLKMVKIKNYVIDQWRPKKKRNSAYESVPQPSHTSNTQQPQTASPNIQNRTENNSNPAIKTNTQHRIGSPNIQNRTQNNSNPAIKTNSVIARAKQQLEQNISNWESRKK